MTPLVFDLDGTLIHSAPDIHAAANAVLSDEGLPRITLDQAIGFIGSGTAIFVARMADAAGVHDEARRARMLDAFLDIYRSAHGLTEPYPGVTAMLDGFAAEGRPMAICTNKPEVPTATVLEALGLRHYFAAVVCGDTLAVRKPDRAPLDAAVAALGGGRALYVGDSETDAETALAAAMPFALYTGGYRRSSVAQLAHDLAFDRHADFPSLVAARD